MLALHFWRTTWYLYFFVFLALMSRGEVPFSSRVQAYSAMWNWFVQISKQHDSMPPQPPPVASTFVFLIIWKEGLNILGQHWREGLSRWKKNSIFVQAISLRHNWAQFNISMKFWFLNSVLEKKPSSNLSGNLNYNPLSLFVSNDHILR